MVFSIKLDKMKHHKVTLHVPASANPGFCKARQIPFALKEAANKELDRLEQAGLSQDGSAVRLGSSSCLGA